MFRLGTHSLPQALEGYQYHTPLRWLGVHHGQIDFENMPKTSLVKLPRSEIRCGKRLLRSRFCRLHPQWAAEVREMLSKGHKVSKAT